MNRICALAALLIVVLLSLPTHMHAKVLTSTSSASAKKLLAGESWEEFCERLKQLGKLVQSDDVPETDIERSEGYRYLLAALAEAIDVSLYQSDVTDP